MYLFGYFGFVEAIFWKKFKITLFSLGIKTDLLDQKTDPNQTQNSQKPKSAKTQLEAVPSDSPPSRMTLEYV